MVRDGLQNKMFQPEKATFRFSYNAMSFCFFVCLAYRVAFIRVKVNRSLYRPGVAQSGGRGIALLFHDRGTRSG